VAVELQRHVNVKLGTLAVDRGFMTIEDVERINRMQRTVDKKFGELAVEKGFITEAQVDDLLGNQKSDRLFLGEALVKKGFLSFEELGKELEAFRADQEGIPGTISEIYTDSPNAPILETFTDVLTKMFLRIADETVKAAPCTKGAAGARFHDFTIYQTFIGSYDGLLCVNLTADILGRIAGKMLGETVGEADEDAQDGASEFVNIVSGNICARLSAMGRTSEIQPPKIHDNRQGSAFNLMEAAAGGEITVTPLLHPESGIELCVVDRSVGEA
jgi:CheY-specific phosphatase CheX